MSDNSREVVLGNTITLKIEVVDISGMPVDADSLPQVEIIDPDGNTARPLSSTGVSRISVGKYQVSYSVSNTAKTGVWADHWVASISGVIINADLEFVALSPGCSIGVITDQIGDPPRVSYTEQEIIGINILLAILSARLKNNLQVESTDAYGNIEFVDCHVFTNDELVWFLNCSLQEFNQTPHFTDFRFSDEVIYNRYCHVIVEGACILAWAAQMLIEAGREFVITDNGITMNPPPLSATLNNELSQFHNAHRENLKFIKACIKPRPSGFGSFRVLASNPNYMRLRHLRERRII